MLITKDFPFVEDCHNRINDLLSNYYTDNQKDFSALLEPLNRALFYSRRRLRSLLVYCGAGVVGGIPENADWIAVLYEIITASYVLIDDSIIFDSGKERANLPTPRIEYGEIPAILSACILQLEPLFLLTKQQIEYSELNKLSKIFYESASNTVKGSYAEHKLSSLPKGTLIDEHKIIEASSLLTSSLLIGAITSGGIIGGGTNHQIDELSNFAANFGIAYQLSDHIVDLMVNNEQTGKDNFSDIKNNQINLVVNYSLQILPFDSSARKEIINILGSHPSLDMQLKLKEIFQETGAIQHCLDIISQYNALATSSLQQLPDNKYRDFLMKLPDIYFEQLISNMKE